MMHTSKPNCIPRIDYTMNVMKEDKIKEVYPITIKYDIKKLEN